MHNVWIFPANHQLPERTASPALVLFSAWIFSFAVLLVDAYALNLLGLPAQPLLLLGLLFLEGLAAAVYLSRHPLRLSRDPLQLAGLLLAVCGTWLYLLYPSWPTLVPPSYSGDAANHLTYIDRIYSTGQIFGNYPGGPALLVATFAHWIGWLPLRVMHPVAAFWLALTAGGVYYLASILLPNRRLHRITALLAVGALYVPWVYFAGILTGPQYFLTQVAAQLFIVAFVIFLLQTLETPHAVWTLGMALCLVAISVSFTLWLAVPLAVFGAVVLLNVWQKSLTSRRALGVAATAVGLPALFWLVVLAVSGTYYLSTPGRFREAGAVVPPSPDALGGLYLVLPVLGVLVSRRYGRRAAVVLLFLGSTLLQTLALAAAGQWLGWADYWTHKSFYLWIYPLALLAVAALAPALEWVQARWTIRRVSPVLGFVATCVALTAGILLFYPPQVFAPLTESEIQVALWAREHLNTRHVNYIGTRSLVAHWFVGLWGEHLPGDLYIAFPALGPKTFEAWRDDPEWGEYLLASSRQHLPLDSSLETVYRWGDSAIYHKPGPAGSPGTAEPLGRFGDTLTLLDYALARETFQRGETISLAAQIKASRVPSRQLAWRLQLRDLENNPAAETRLPPFDDKFPLQRWPDGIRLSQGLSLTLPVDLRPGLYRLQLGLYGVGDGRPQPFRAENGEQDDVLQLAHIKVKLPPVTEHELGATVHTDVRLGNDIHLIGYRLSQRSPLRRAEPVRLVLYWQSLAPVARDYTVFVHLLDPRGSLRAQVDRAPRGGTYPTSIWEANEIIVDPYTLTIPPDAPAGDYAFEVGMYPWPELTRLPVTEHGSPPSDHVLLPAGLVTPAD